MNKPYWGLWALLCAALVFFAVLSFWPDGFNVGGMSFKTASFAQNMKELFVSTPDTVPADTLDAEGRLPNGKHPVGWRAPMDTTSKTILFFGDSMLEGLGQRLAAYCDKNGHKLIEVIWYSSSTLCWGQTSRAAELIKEYNPDYIFVCLGANELYVPEIKKNREPYLKKILAEIGDIPYVWIGPPNWDEDTGINAMIQENVDEGSFYLSANDSFERGRDGAHPTRASAALWMDRVVQWVKDKGAHPIKLDTPAVAKSRASRIIVFQPPV